MVSKGTRQGAQGGNTGSVEWSPQALRRRGRARRRQEERWTARSGPVTTRMTEEADMTMTDYECGQCGWKFSTNCDEDDIACTECGANRCPHCDTWFGDR